MIAFLRRNRWRMSIVVVLLLILLVVRFIIFTTVSRSASQASIGQPDALTITVVLHRDTTKTTKVIYTQTLHNTIQSHQLYQEIVSGHIVKSDEVYNCPNMSTTYYSYSINFQQKGKTVIEASVNAGGCNFWVVKNLPNEKQTIYTAHTDTLWANLHKYTGAPEPSQALRG